jgi:hypothetical protein
MIHLSHTIATADLWGFAILLEQPHLILSFRQPIPNFQNGKKLFSCGSLSKRTFIYTVEYQYNEIEGTSKINLL